MRQPCNTCFKHRNNQCSATEHRQSRRGQDNRTGKLQHSHRVCEHRNVPCSKKEHRATKTPERQWTGRFQGSRAGKVQQKHRVNRLLIWTRCTILTAAMVATASAQSERSAAPPGLSKEYSVRHTHPDHHCGHERRIANVVRRATRGDIVTRTEVWVLSRYSHIPNRE